MKYQIIIAWNREAAMYAEEHGMQAACDKQDDEFNIEVYEFATYEEASAFCFGVAESNGWDSPYWEEIQEINE